MNKLLQPTLLALLLAASPLGQAAEPASDDQGAGAAFFLSRDNEGFTTRRLALEYLPDYQHADALTGVRYTDHHYSQHDWQRDGQQIALLHRQIDPATANGWQIDTGLFRQGGHDLLTLDGNYRRALAPRTGLELFVNRDWVETQNSLDRGVHFNYWGASLDQGLGEHVTLVGLAARQDFSDGNERSHGRLKLIYQPWLDLGLTLQARYRTYHSSSDDVDGAYFNPKNYDESMLAVGWRKRLQGWTGTLTAGLGRQQVNDDPRSNTRLLELGLQSPLRAQQSLRLRGGYSQSASFNGPDYRYRYLQGEWIARF